MQRSEWDFENNIENDQDSVAWPGSPEERVDHLGVRTALVVLCAAFFIAAMWLVTRPSFEKSSASSVCAPGRSWLKSHGRSGKPFTSRARLPSVDRRYEQNLGTRQIATLILSTRAIRLEDLLPHVPNALVAYNPSRPARSYGSD